MLLFQLTGIPSISFQRYLIGTDYYAIQVFIENDIDFTMGLQIGMGGSHKSCMCGCILTDGPGSSIRGFLNSGGDAKDGRRDSFYADWQDEAGSRKTWKNRSRPLPNEIMWKIGCVQCLEPTIVSIFKKTAATAIVLLA